MYVNTTDHIQKSLFWYGNYEKNISLLWQRFVKTDSIVLDIGANIGYFSLLAAGLSIKGQVYSFEPVAFIREQLLKNISLNQLLNIQVFPFCVSNENVLTTIFIADRTNIGMSGLRMPENFSGVSENIHSIIIDEWIEVAAIKKVNLIKIDIEGAEIKALEGMRIVLEKHRPVVFIEVIASLLAKFDNSVNDVYDFFYNYNYEAYEMIGKRIKPVTGYCAGNDIIFIPKNYKIPDTIEMITS